MLGPSCSPASGKYLLSPKARTAFSRSRSFYIAAEIGNLEYDCPLAQNQGKKENHNKSSLIILNPYSNILESTIYVKSMRSVTSRLCDRLSHDAALELLPTERDWQTRLQLPTLCSPTTKASRIAVYILILDHNLEHNSFINISSSPKRTGRKARDPEKLKRSPGTFARPCDVLAFLLSFENQTCAPLKIQRLKLRKIARHTEASWYSRVLDPTALVPPVGRPTSEIKYTGAATCSVLQKIHHKTAQISVQISNPTEPAQS